MWIYKQSSGQLWLNGKLIGVGYSGFEQGKNNQELEAVPEIGPIPHGRYDIGQAFTDAEKGPLVMPLTPKAGTDTFQRSGFLIHGDSLKDPGCASRGCVVLDHAIRFQISESLDRTLWVI